MHCWLEPVVENTRDWAISKLSKTRRVITILHLVQEKIKTMKDCAIGKVAIPFSAWQAPMA